MTIRIEGFARQAAAIASRRDSLRSCHTITIPTLMVAADDDPLTPPALSDEMTNSIPAARLLRLHECGHGSTLEPDSVNPALAEWLA